MRLWVCVSEALQGSARMNASGALAFLLILEIIVLPGQLAGEGPATLGA